MRFGLYERMFDLMDRAYELVNLRRSIFMLSTGSKAISREDAVALIAELQETVRRLGALGDGLRQYGRGRGLTPLPEGLVANIGEVAGRQVP